MEPELTWEAVMAGCTGDMPSEWGVFVIDGRTVIAPNINAAMRTTQPKQLPPASVTSFEHGGGHDFDCISYADLAYAELVATSERQINAVKGEIVAAALTAMHAQRRSDGRPVPYLPEENL